MTYRATMLVDRPHLAANHPERTATITTRVGGCADEDDARQKLRSLYTVLKFKKVESVDEAV